MVNTTPPFPSLPLIRGGIKEGCYDYRMEMFSLFAWKKQEAIFVALVMLGILVISWYQIKIGEMKTRDSQRMQDVELVRRAIITFYADYHVYPPEAAGEGKLVACGEKGSEICEWGKGSIKDKYNVVYLNKVPRDPLTERGYSYEYKTDSDRQRFKIYIALEYLKDPRFKKDLTIKCGNNVQCNWYVQD